MVQDHILELITLAQPYYLEPHRQYHTIQHIHRMFCDVRTHNVELNALQQVAILFHDAVYTPGSKTNELDSARLVKVLEQQNTDIFRSYNMLSSDVDIICNIIKDTQDHIPTSIYSKLVIDLDLLGLADEYDEYLAAGQRVRQEFAYLTEEEWKLGRIKFLDSFINRDYIFQTEYFRLFEEQAKENLKQERLTLDSQ